VLYVHGATFPAPLAFFWRFDGTSWADVLTNAGHDVFGLDFIGFGRSDRYAEMDGPCEGGRCRGRADEAADQIAAAVEHVRERTGAARVHLIAHSWGTMPTALYATRSPEAIERLVLFAPITARFGATAPAAANAAPAWHLVSAADQWSRFSGYLPSGEEPVLPREWFDPWGAAYIATDERSHVHSPHAVKVPAGPLADIEAALTGALPYDPARVRVPTLMVRGEWDHWPTDSDAQWLFDSLVNAPMKRDVKIPRGTHVMHLETSRLALFRAVQNFF
jgi:pimeloyl-ACP methyl ester carboxylesterase